MSHVDKAKVHQEKANQIHAGIQEAAHRKLCALYNGRIGKRLLDAVLLAEVAYGAPFTLLVKQQEGKLTLSTSHK
jgi:hypothetical protein